MKIYWTTKEKFDKYVDTLHQNGSFKNVPYKDGILMYLELPENTELTKANL